MKPGSNVPSGPNTDFAEIAAALRMTRRAIEGRASRGKWPYTEQDVKGGKKRYFPLDAIPKEVSEAVRMARLNALYAEARQPDAPKVGAGETAALTVAAPAPLVKLTSGRLPSGAYRLSNQVRAPKTANTMNDRDRRYQTAALMLCNAVDSHLMALDRSEKAAIVQLAGQIIDGVADAELIQASQDTYLKPRPDGQTQASLVSRLQKMMTFYRAGRLEGDAGKYLVAGYRKKEGQKHEDVVAFLQHFCRPNRPDIMQAWRDAEPWYQKHNLTRPHVSTFRRIERGLPVTVKYRGRMTGASYVALQPYVSRDVSMFKANDIWVGDGHGFKARVRSALTGKPFQPEVTVVLDWVSRKIVGWSVALSESTIAVSDAFRHAQFQTRARPLIYYSDQGSGQTGKQIDHPITGTLARQGIFHATGRPNHPQARGVIERLWQTTLIPLASSYPTFLTKAGDRDTIRRTTLTLAKADRAGEVAAMLPTFDQFLLDVAACFTAYNANHAHSALNGMTPDATYTARLDPDSIVFGATDGEIEALWMPEEIRSHARGTVKLFNNQYFLDSLPDLLREGETLRVRYDIHDASQVWLWRMDGTPLGVALWEGNKEAAYPVPFVEKKRQERCDGIITRAVKEIERAEAERGLPDGTVFEGERVEIDITPLAQPEAVEAVAAPEAAQVIPLRAPMKKPNLIQADDPTVIRWLAAHPEDWTEPLRNYLREQAEKLNQVSNLIDEYNLWDALYPAVDIPEEEARIAVSSN